MARSERQERWIKNNPDLPLPTQVAQETLTVDSSDGSSMLAMIVSPIPSFAVLNDND